MADHQGTPSYFAQLSRELMAQGEERPTLQAVVERAVDVVPACDFASVTIRRRRHRMQTVGSSSQTATWCDSLQYELDEGPCVDTVIGSPVHVSQELGSELRWPRWGSRVAEAGVHAVLSIQLSTEQETIGALNLYSTEPHSFDEDQIDLALVYTTHATNALASSRMVAGLRTAVDSRHLIGVAQGILMSGYGLSMDASFEVLRRYSSRLNLKLRDVAEFVVFRGTLPDMPDGDEEPRRRT